jgi:hypothetical protein
VTVKANRLYGTRDSGEGQSPEVAARGTGSVVSIERNLRVNGRWVRWWWERRQYLVRGENSEGQNPRSAVGLKHNQPGLGGSNPPGGYSNPEGGT